MLKNSANNFTPVNNVFIDKYMLKARGEFVKVYILLLKYSMSGEPGISSSILAAKLNLLESDIMNALSYWNEVLTKYNFYKPHSSYLVNLKYISKINKELLELSTGEIIYFSKRKYKEFKEKYMEYIISEI